jgi:hypothetical protein
MANPTCLPATGVTATGGVANGNADNIPAGQFLRVSHGVVAGGPYGTNGPNVPGTNTLDQPATAVVSALAPGTTVYYVVQELAADGTTVLAQSGECSFTTAAVPGSGFQPMPCADCGGGGGGEPGPDAESNLLCDTMPDGTIVGTALAVYTFDENGNPTGPPVLVIPGTDQPYVPQGIMMACPGETGCLAPVQFCFTTTTTGPVDHPGRMYDLDLPINPGFAVQSLNVDAVSSPANIVWNVDDPDGEAFRAELTTFIEARVPSDAVVTITNPNAGTPQVCGTALPMQIHIECVRLDQTPPNLIELVYNGGQDLIQNPAYNEFPPLNPPVSQGNYGFRLLSREDDPGPFPGNPPANDTLCTTVANRGWETNDIGRTFEIWGQDIVLGSNVTPTPRGTPVQEITSDGPPPGGISTIWQTFQAPASGNFVIRVVHGARDAGEIHRITLDNGDTDDAQNGDLIDDVTTPAVVTNSPGGPGPWTTFSQTLPLTAGNVYTLALSTTENPPDGNARGGLFTDMRAYIDRPDLRATAATDDDTCVVTVDETSTVTTCEYWQPRCINGDVVSWVNVADGEELDNTGFWGQTPAPSCCLPEAGEGGGGSVVANLIHSYLICGVVGGVQQTLVRYVITDPSGGVLASQIVGADGAPVAPASWEPGACSDQAYINDEILCDVLADGTTIPFLRKFVQQVNATNQPTVVSIGNFNLDGTIYAPVGTVQRCADNAPNATDSVVLCDNVAVALVDPIPSDITAVPPNPPQQQGALIPAVAAVQAFFDGGTVVVPSWGTSPPTPRRFPIQGNVDPIAVAPCGPPTTVSVTVEFDAENIGDGSPSSGTISIILRNGAATVATQSYGPVASGSTPHVAVSAIVPYADLQAGNISFWADFLAWQPTVRPSFELTNFLLTVRDANPAPACLTDIEVTRFVRTFVRDANGNVITTADSTLDGAVYAVQGTVSDCDEGTGQTLGPVCFNTIPPGPVSQSGFMALDGNGEPVLYNLSGEVVPDPYVIVICADTGVTTQILCDFGNAGHQFIRSYLSSPIESASAGLFDLELDGETAYAVVGPVGLCGDAAVSDTRDAEVLVLCDATPTRFLRKYLYDGETGAFTGILNTTLDGNTPFAPVGAVGVCAANPDFDFLSTVLCDSNGTQFIQRLTFNSATGVVTATTNTTLTGGAFAPVGAVSLCTTCCPIEIGQGCYTGGSGRYTALRLANGTISLIDSVTGAAVLAANIIPCADDDVARTLTAQHRLVGDADPAWTPGADVVGTLTSVTYTILSGSATVTDSNGTVAAGLPPGLSVTWNASDDNTLTGPTSIDAVAGNVYVHWTVR